MSPTDIIIVAAVLIFAFLGIKRVKNLIKHGTCVCCQKMWMREE